MQKNQNNALAQEITSKTIEANKNKSNVNMFNIDDVLPLKNRGGFRAEEQITNLENEIRKNGIIEPIKLIRKEDGSIKIYDGNHRLEIAQKLGLSQVPVKFVEDYVDNTIDNRYNTLKRGDSINESITKISNEIGDNYAGNENIQGSGFRDNILSNREQTLQRDDTVYPPMVRYNNGSSGDTTSKGNTEKRNSPSNGLDKIQLSREKGNTTETGLEDSSFNLPINKDNLQKFTNKEEAILPIVKTNKTLNPLEISNLTKEDANTTPLLPNVNRNKFGNSNLLVILI